MDLFQNLNNFNGNIINPLHIKGYLSGISVFIAVIVFAISIVQCFYGYKLLKWWTSFIGSALFGLAGYGIFYNLKGDADTAVICGLVVGLIGALISFSLYKAGVVVISFGAGFLAGYMLSDSVQTAAVFGIISGILVLLFMKPVLIITIAVSSGILAGKNLAIILGAGSDTSVMLSAIFVVLGTLFQWKGNIRKSTANTFRRKDKQRKTKNKKPLDLSTDGIKNVFYKLKNKIKFDDDDEEDEYGYYDDGIEFIPVDNYPSSGEKNESMEEYKKSEQETEEEKLFKKINEKAKDEFNVNDFLNEEQNRESEGHSNRKRKTSVRCPRCNNLCNTYDKFCKKCGEKLIM